MPFFARIVWIDIRSSGEKAERHGRLRCLTQFCVLRTDFCCVKQVSPRPSPTRGEGQSEGDNTPIRKLL